MYTLLSQEEAVNCKLALEFLEPTVQDSEDLPFGYSDTLPPSQQAEMVVQATEESAGITSPYAVSRTASTNLYSSRILSTQHGIIICLHAGLDSRLPMYASRQHRASAKEKKILYYCRRACMGYEGEV